MKEKNIPKNAINIHTFFYIVIVLLIITLKILSSMNFQYEIATNISLINSFFTKMSIIFCIILFMLEKKYTKNKILYIAFGLLLAFIIFYSGGNLSVIQIITIIAAYPRSLDSTKICKYESYLILFLIVVAIVLNSLGIITNNEMYRNDNILRSSLGFVSANVLSNTFTLSLIPYIYYKKEKWNIKNTIVWTIMSILIYSVTNSRMALITCLFLIFLVNIIKKKHSNIVYKLAKYSYYIVVILSVLFTIFYVNGIFPTIVTKINEFFSYRLSYMGKYYLNPGISLFGQALEFISLKQVAITGEKWSGLDNSYIYILLSWGIVGFILYTFCLMKMLKQRKKEKNIYAFICTIALNIIGLTENYLSIFAYNLIFILIAENFAKEYSIKKRKDENE